MKIKPGDIITVAVVLVLGFVCLFAFSPQNDTSSGKSLKISVNGIPEEEISLPSDRKTLDIEGVIIEIDGEDVHVSDSDCTDKTCVRMGTINRKGESVVCLPNGVVLEIDSPSETGPDAILH